MSKYTIWIALFAIPLLYALSRCAPLTWQIPIAFGLHWGLAAIILVWANLKRDGPTDIGLRRAFVGFICFVTIVAAYCAGLNVWFGTHLLADWQYGVMVGFGRWSYVFVAISAGFCEEVIYRGYMMTELKRAGQPVWLAMVLSTFSFVVFHGLLPLPMMVTFFIIGMIWAAIFHSTSILWTTIYIHALWNASVALVPWSSFSGS